MPGAVPLPERLKRVFAAPVSELPETTWIVLLSAALTDGDAVREILQAAGAVAGANWIWTWSRLPSWLGSSTSTCRRRHAATPEPDQLSQTLNPA